MPTITALPLTHCPVCNYDLTGLPKNHRCPECGFEYEDSMRVWYGRKPSWWFIVCTALGLALFPWVVGSLTSFNKTGNLLIPSRVFTQIPLWVLMGFFAFAGLGLSLGLTLYLVRRKPAFLILSDDALHLGLPFRRIRRFVWRDLDVRGWATKHFEAEQGASRPWPASRSFGWRRRLARYGILGSWFEFRVVRKRTGASDPTIRLGVFYSSAATKDDVQRAVYERWKRFQESQPADSQPTDQNPER